MLYARVYGTNRAPYPTPDHEDTTDEGIQTIQEGILTNLFLLVTMY